jgi:Putative GTPase activating protein for Arf
MSVELLRSIHNTHDNLKCFECERNSSSWACTENCIFLCIDCAHALKSECGSVVMIKSLSMASWSSEDLVVLQCGGNLRLKSLLIQYAIPKNIKLGQKYTCRALEYYRDLIKSEAFNHPLPCPPKLDEGIDLIALTSKSWWGSAREKMRNWVNIGNHGVIEGVTSNLNTQTLEKIKSTGINAICGLREITCTTAYSALSSYDDHSQPDYIKMEDKPNTDNNR